VAVRVFGIRHHGPGSARALAASLRSWEPDAVLIEGPPEAEAVLALAGSAAMRPPVALLGYLPARPARAAFYPMAAWSPEWVALRHALDAGITVRMIDLPAAVTLSPQVPVGDSGEDPERGGDPDAGEPGVLAPAGTRGDPLGRLAQLAGYDDTERWWEDMIELRGGEEPWDAITEAVAELRASPETDLDRGEARTEARREASMRQGIRAAARTHQRVAVVCGAWHAPALVDPGPARADRELLGGLTRERAAVTWVPWTNDRLSFASGYGAGVTSPGWYEHLFVSPDRPIERWMIKVATLLRAEGLDAPPASVIDAVRLADTLATMRGRPLAGLSECTDAARASLTGGHEGGLALVGRRLVVGDVIGQVPPDTPMVALAADLAALQKRLRMKPQPTVKALELDLRKDYDVERSQLLHRMHILGIRWGVLDLESRSTGTFRETWTLGWQPEMAVQVIEASVHGNTVESAAAHRSTETAAQLDSLAGLTRLIERCLLADLPAAVEAAMAALDHKAAHSRDVSELMGSIPPLARVMRYGTVRRTDTDAVERVVRGLVARVCVGLAPACASLDDDSAAEMAAHLSAVTAAVGSVDDAPLREEWLAALAPLSASPRVHGLPVGRASRILLDAGALTAAGLADRLSSALSHGEDPARAAAWVEGLIAGSGLLLVHDRVLLAIIDSWLASVGPESFDEVVPLLRRSFSSFESGERRHIAEAARRLDGRGPGPSDPGGGSGARGLGDVDPERARRVLPLLQLLLGGPAGGPGTVAEGEP